MAGVACSGASMDSGSIHIHSCTVKGGACGGSGDACTGGRGGASVFVSATKSSSCVADRCGAGGGGRREGGSSTTCGAQSWRRGGRAWCLERDAALRLLALEEHRHRRVVLGGRARVLGLLLPPPERDALACAARGAGAVGAAAGAGRGGPSGRGSMRAPRLR